MFARGLRKAPVRGTGRATSYRHERMERIMKVLMVLTSHDQLGNTGRKTGFWLEELAAPCRVGGGAH